MSQPMHCTRSVSLDREVPESIVLAVDPRLGYLDPDQAAEAAQRGYRVWLGKPPYDSPLVPFDAECVIGVGCALGERPLWDYHAQLRLLREVSGGAAQVLDVSAQTVRIGAWLDEIAASDVPPSPLTLYTMHSVFEARHRPLWLHTHGLERCGAIELDVLEVPSGFMKSAAELLHLASMSFIEEGIPEADEPFAIGQGIELVWLPWEEGIHKVGRRSLGGRKDRHDAQHTGARGILFANTDYQNLAIYRDVMEEDPLVYVPPMEIERAQLLAVERLPRFRALFERFGGTRGWKFLVKLGYPTDYRDDDGVEYLWFEVHAFDGDRIDATLRNHPYYIASMYDGQRGMHALARLSDWSIRCPKGNFDADTIGALELQPRLLQERAGG